MELLGTVDSAEQAQVIETLLQTAAVLSQKYGLSPEEVERSIHWAMGEIARGYQLAELAIKDPKAAKEQGVDTLAFAPVAVAVAAVAPEVVTAMLATLTMAVATTMVNQEKERQDQARAQHGMDAAPEGATWKDAGVNTEEGKASVLSTPIEDFEAPLLWTPIHEGQTHIFWTPEHITDLNDLILQKSAWEQGLNVRPGQEWKELIKGRPQVTGTEGHDFTSIEVAIEWAKSGMYKEIRLNRAYKTATGVQTTPRRLPDVIGIRHDGKVDVVEVRSRTDNEKELRQRNQEAMKQLPESMRGDIDIRYSRSLKDQQQ
jgi:hypothetical protein